MLILSLICGLGVGSYLPVNMSVVITAGMILSIAMPIIGPVVSMFGIGLGVAVTAKNVIQTAFTKKTIICKEEIKHKKEDEIQNYKKEIAEVAAKETSKEYNSFATTVMWTALPMYLLNLIQGLATFLLPVSILAIVVKAWVKLHAEPEKAISYGLVALAVLASAFFTISTGSTSSVFLYFLTLVSIPSALKKEDPDVEEAKEATSGTSMPLEAFLYGQGGNSSIITAMVMLQTILWGSGKDAIGTIVNGSPALALDPFRVTACIVVIIFLFLFNIHRKEYVIAECVRNFTNKKAQKKKRFINTALNAVSLVFSLSVANPFVVITMTIIGLIVNAFVKTSTIRNLAVPALLVIGGLGF